MNNIRVKNVSKALIMLFLMQPCAMESIQMPWYESYFNTGNGTHYRENCQNISTIQNIRGAYLFAYHRLTHKKANLDGALHVIKDQLTEFETWLITAEQDALIAIKTKYEISDKKWQQYLTEVQQMKDVYTNGMRNNHPIVIHDRSVPTDIMEMLTTLLKQNDINPQSLYIKMVTDKEKIDAHKNTIAQAKSSIEMTITHEPNDNLTISHRYIPSVIEIFPQMVSVSTEDKISFCAHEIQHLIQHHAITEAILINYLEHYYDITREEFKKTSEYHKLSHIHEAQAEILSAIKNPEIAQHLKAMRKKSYYPDHLYEEHFFHLAHIDMLWKVHGWLEFFHQDGVGKIKNNWFNKITHCTDSFKQLIGC